MHIMMPILAKFHPFLYLKTGTNIHDILNISIFQFHSSTMSIANGQTVLKIGKTVLTSLPLHHQSTSIKHRRIHHHFHRFLSNLQYFPRLKRRRVVVE